MTPLHWQDLTAPELARRAAAKGATALLPLHAVEQHGAHLPLSTDLEIGRGVLAAALGELPGDRPLLVLPEQGVGASREHGRVPGTLWIPGALLTDWVIALGRGLATSGIGRLVVFSAHGGNRAVLDEAGLVLRDEVDLLVVKVTLARLPRPELPPHGPTLPDAEWQEGIHGGAVETSMMLHLRPDLVRMEALEEDRASAPPPGALPAGHLRVAGGKLAPEGPAPLAWLAGDLHPSGVAGDPRLASAELGRHLVTGYGRWLAALLDEVMGLSPAPGDAAGD